MTPEEKARELVLKYLRVKTQNWFDKILAKQCALIAVDEILSNDGFSSSILEWDIFISYWQEVKREIDKL